MRRALSVAFVLVALPALLLPGSSNERVVAEPATKEKMSPIVKKLLEQRVDALKRTLKAVLARRGTDLQAPGIEYVVNVARRLRDAELRLATTPRERIAAHLAYFRFVCQEDDRAVNLHFKAGAGILHEVWSIRATRLGAEADLRQAGGTPPKDTKPPQEIIDPRKRKPSADE
jgi:hypothetical protein